MTDTSSDPDTGTAGSDINADMIAKVEDEKRNRLYREAYQLVTESCRGVGGVFDEDSMRNVVRGLRALRSEVDMPTKRPAPRVERTVGVGSDGDMPADVSGLEEDALG